jgi:hypothetical protein
VEVVLLAASQFWDPDRRRAAVPVLPEGTASRVAGAALRTVHALLRMAVLALSVRFLLLVPAQLLLARVAPPIASHQPTCALLELSSIRVKMLALFATRLVAY